MTDKQHRWYLREWSAAFRAHWAGSSKGEAVPRHGRPANAMRDKVIAAAQRLAATREDGRLSPDLLRRACHLVGIGNDVSSWALRNKQIDQVVAVFRLLAGSGDIAAQMKLDAAEIEQARRTIAARASDTGTTTDDTPNALPDADRARLLHGLRKVDLPAAYVRELARDKFGTENWESLPAEKLLQLLMTAKARAQLRQLGAKVRCVPASANASVHA